MKALGKSLLLSGVASLILGLLHLTPTRYGSHVPDLGISPIAIVVIAVASWAVIYCEINRRSSMAKSVAIAMWAGFWFNVLSLHWVGESLNYDHDQFSWLAVISSLGCTAIMFPWWGLATLLAILLGRRVGVGPSLFAVCWLVSDVLKSDFVYGIPLSVQAVILLDTPFDVVLRTIGTQGAGALIVWLGANVGHVMSSKSGFTGLAISGATCALLVWISPVQLERDQNRAGLSALVATVQLNNPVPVRYLDDGDYEASTTLLVQAALREAFSLGADLVLLPESTFLTDPAGNPGTLKMIKDSIPADGYVVLGTREVITSGDIVDGIQADTFNVAHLISPKGIEHTYRKSHLVVFGEYMPLIFRIMGYDVIGGPTGGLSEGSGLATISAGQIPPFILTICFESLLSGPVQRAIADAEWIANISNETLFGYTAGSELLNAFNRMRSIELGVPLLRSTMTSHAGSIMADGSQASMAPSRRFWIDTQPVTAATHETVFRRFGFFPLYLVVIGVSLFHLRAPRRDQLFERGRYGYRK